MKKVETKIPKKKKAEKKYRFDFTPNGVDLRSFPYNVWRKLSKDILVEDRTELFRSGDPQGEYSFRNAICNYLYQARGVSCAPHQIIVGAGSDYLLMLLRMIIGENHRIAFEDPAYKQAYRMAESLGYQTVPIPLDKNGMKIEELESSGADIAYVTPSHQYPTGIVMPMKRRLELLNWAMEEPERYIIEDDYDSEFRYKGKPIPALQGIDRFGRVIYLGTFSKSVAPSTRISYMVLPKQLLSRFRECCGFYACTVPNLMQQAICQFMKAGYFEKNLNRMRAIYKAKHDFMLAELRKYPWVLNIMGENSGLHLLVEVGTTLTEQGVIQKCAEQKIRVYGLSEYYISQNPKREYPSLLLGYGGLTEEQIADGLQMIDGVLAEMACQTL